mgnify:CR=1 FL=1
MSEPRSIPEILLTNHTAQFLIGLEGYPFGIHTGTLTSNRTGDKRIERAGVAGTPRKKQRSHHGLPDLPSNGKAGTVLLLGAIPTSVGSMTCLYASSASSAVKEQKTVGGAHPTAVALSLGPFRVRCCGLNPGTSVLPTACRLRPFASACGMRPASCIWMAISTCLS